MHAPPPKSRPCVQVKRGGKVIFSSIWHPEDGEPGEAESFVDEVVVIERPIYTQKEFDQGFEGGQRPKHTPLTYIRSQVRKCECSFACVRRSVAHKLPFLAIMRDYNFKTDLIADAIAGLTVGIMHIPQGMAYGQLSTLPPVFGLYVSFFPVILYFFFGSSKHVSIGTFAVVSLMVGSTVDKGMKARSLVPEVYNKTIDAGGGNMTYELSDNSEEILNVKLMLAMSVTFAVGVLQILLGVFRLGFLTVYLSDPLISGFTTGAAIHVFTSQIKHIFGISTGRYSGAFKLVYTYYDIFKNLPDTNAVTFIASIVCMILLWVVKEYINGNPKIKPKLKMPIPTELIVVALGTVISYFVKLEETYKVKTVGDIPVGIPAPNLNAFTCLSEVIADSIAIAIVSFAISVSMAKIFAKKHDYAVDSNQELLAYGTCNVVSSFFSSFVSTVSLSRSLVQENVGGRTQVTGLVSSALLLVVLLVIGPYFKTLPNCVLASIILVALKGMFMQFLELKTLWGISMIDFATWLITFCATVFLDVDLGLLVGVVFALLTVIMKSQRPYACLLGQVPGTDIYRDLSVYKTAEEVPNIKIFRFDCPIFFANSEFFKSTLYKHTVDPYVLKKMQKKINKKKKKDEKHLLNITVDSVGSADIQTTEIDSTPNGPLSTSVDPSKKLDSPTAPKGLPDPHFISQAPTLTDIHYIIIDCATMSYVDSMGVKVLQQVISEFRAFNITVYLAQCKSSVREMFECTNFYKTASKNYMFLTIHDAVVSAQLHHWSVTGENPGHLSNNNNTALTDTAQTEEETDKTDEETDKTDEETEELSEEVVVSSRTAALDNHVQVLERTHV
ncbi:prestin-like isoform X2 [Physella acuta]|uniref:prestin-like isoform X2 n=1 Tax=Physella acuta TaxID=109671 RepID=UPI0027DD45D9|nr:prestin-like isoform X2 [Physella acuta]